MRSAAKHSAGWPDSRTLPGAASLAAILLLIAACSL